MARPYEEFDTDQITDCIDALAEMAKDDPAEVRRIVDQEFSAHPQISRHIRPFAEEFPQAAIVAGLIK